MLHSLTSSGRPQKSTVVRSETTVRLARAALQAAFAVSDEVGARLAERMFTTPRRHDRPARERSALATARPFRIAATVGSSSAPVDLAAWRWGNGPTALLVHGWEGRGSQLASFVEPLVAAGMSVVAFDAPAHGDSGGSRLYLTDLADAIAAVAARVGPVQAVIAHSFGCAGTLLARARGGFDAPRFAMIAPNVVVDDPLAGFAQLLALDAAERAALEGRLTERAGLDRAALALDQLVGSREGELLVVHDRGDHEVAFTQGERVAALWPRAQLVGTDGLGHRRILRDPDVIARVTAFVTRDVRPPVSDLVREVDRCLAHGDL